MIIYSEDRTVGHREWAREIWALVRAERETPQPEQNPQEEAAMPAEETRDNA